ncbi:MAG: peptidoglycan DD-metalloendopeptidase family protein [Paludibacter sp.]
MKKFYLIFTFYLLFVNLKFSDLVAQKAIVPALSETCMKVNSALEDPTPAQIAAGIIPTVNTQLTWIRPAESTYRVAFSGTVGSAASHEGVDYVNDNQLVNTVYVRAAAKGKVVYVREGCDQSSMFAHNNIARESGAGWGNHIVILHNNQLYTRYGHLLKGTILVNNGDSVQMGQIIATMGNSGRSETRHTHFELGTKVTAFDPCAMSQNFDKVYNSELLAFSTYNNQINLTSPLNNKDSISMNPVLVWGKDISSNNYTVDIAADAAFNNIVKTSITSDNYLKLAALNVGTYYWRVKSDKSNYSQIWNFQVKPSEGFENCLKDGLPTNWSRFAVNVIKGTITSDNAWVATDIDRHNLGKFSARMGNYMSVSDCWMLSPKIAITTLTKTLSFNWANTAGDYGSKLELFVSESETQPTTATSFLSIKTIAEGVDALWHSENLDLTSYIGKQIFIGFKVHNFGDPADVNAGGDNWWIDDVVLPTQSVSSHIQTVNSLINKVTVFPNPVSGFAQINISTTNKAKIDIDIIDYCGKKIENIESTNLMAGNYSYRWNCSNFPNGIYMVKVSTDTEIKIAKITKIK